MTGLLNPNTSEIGHFLCIILVVCLSHGIFYTVAVIVSSETVFGRDLSSKIKEPQKKWCTSFIARVFLRQEEGYDIPPFTSVFERSYHTYYHIIILSYHTIISYKYILS